jgi:chromosomal replication initiation ATPase DnaA
VKNLDNGVSKIKQRYLDENSKDEEIRIIEALINNFSSKKIKLTKEIIFSKNRTREASEARFAGIYIVKKYFIKDITLNGLSNWFTLEKKDHTTIINSLNKFNDFMEYDPFFRKKYNKVLQELKHI